MQWVSSAIWKELKHWNFSTRLSPLVLDSTPVKYALPCYVLSYSVLHIYGYGKHVKNLRARKVRRTFKGTDWKFSFFYSSCWYFSAKNILWCVFAFFHHSWIQLTCFWIQDSRKTKSFKVGQANNGIIFSKQARNKKQDQNNRRQTYWLFVLQGGSGAGLLKWPLERAVHWDLIHPTPPNKKKASVKRWQGHNLLPEWSINVSCRWTGFAPFILWGMGVLRHEQLWLQISASWIGPRNSL